MRLWFLTGLLRGVVTTRYPDRPEPSVRGLPAPPAFVPDLLTEALAERVAEACPNGALRRCPAGLRLDLGLCTGCGRCIAAGGPGVRSSEQIELAATSRDLLVKVIPIGPGTAV